MVDCPSCQKANTEAATYCVWCHAKLPRTRHNSESSKKSLYGVLPIVISGVFAAGFFIASRGTTTAPSPKPAPVPTPTAKPRPKPVSAPAPLPTPVPVYTPLVKPNPVVQPTPAPVYNATWHDVASFGGTSAKTTGAFRIQGSQWRITWACVPTGNYGNSFSIIVKSPTESMFNLAANIANQEASDTTYVYGAGTYYLDIGGIYSSYSISIEDYY